MYLITHLDPTQQPLPWETTHRCFHSLPQVCRVGNVMFMCSLLSLVTDTPTFLKGGGGKARKQGYSTFILQNILLLILLQQFWLMNALVFVRVSGIGRCLPFE